jgi:hypothetical protein
VKYLKTEPGQAAFKARSPLFSARQRSSFILFDGVKSAEQLVHAGVGVTQSDIDYMVEQGFLAPVLAPQAEPVAPVAVRNLSDQDRYKEAKPLATQLTAGLGLRGFLLNLSVESASGFAELLVLLPKIQDAVGTKACQELERALKG